MSFAPVKEMEDQKKSHNLKKYLDEVNAYQTIVESIAALGECDPKPENPLLFIASKLGYDSVASKEFATIKQEFTMLKQEFHCLQCVVCETRSELAELKKMSTEEDSNNNQLLAKHLDDGETNESSGLIFGDICFEKFMYASNSVQSSPGIAAQVEDSAGEDNEKSNDSIYDERLSTIDELSNEESNEMSDDAYVVASNQLTTAESFTDQSTTDKDDSVTDVVETSNTSSEMRTSESDEYFFEATGTDLNGTKHSDVYISEVNVDEQSSSLINGTDQSEPAEIEIAPVDEVEVSSSEVETTPCEIPEVETQNESSQESKECLEQTQGDVTNEIDESQMLKDVEQLITRNDIAELPIIDFHSIEPADSNMENADVVENVDVETTGEETVTCNILQKIPNERLREITGLDISDSAECYMLDTVVQSVLNESESNIEDAASRDDSGYDMEALEAQIETNEDVKIDESEDQHEDDVFPSSISSSSCNSLNTIEEKLPNLVEDEDKKSSLLLEDDAETAFLLSIS